MGRGRELVRTGRLILLAAVVSIVLDEPASAFRADRRTFGERRARRGVRARTARASAVV